MAAALWQDLSEERRRHQQELQELKASSQEELDELRRQLEDEIKANVDSAAKAKELEVGLRCWGREQGPSAGAWR